jgi:hypothetical protein
MCDDHVTLTSQASSTGKISGHVPFLRCRVHHKYRSICLLSEVAEVADQLSEKHIARATVMGIREMPRRLPSSP